MKNKQLLIIPFLVIAIFSKAQINAPVNVPALGISPTGNDPSSIFSYQNHPTAHYGIGWYNDNEFTGAAMGYLSAYGGLKFFTAGQPKMMLDVYGRLGIGTNSPTGKVEIKGPFDGNSQLIINTTSSNAELRFSDNNVIKGFVWYDKFSDGMAFGRGSTSNSIWVNTSGNVGIGSLNPGYKLDVIGTIRSREVKVDMNGADFVFEKDYGLMPLSDLEKYITTNKHLPQIATAKEMETNGVELGNLNSKLLQKVEELTLYIIQMNKEIDKLKTQISSNR
ncbi:hypothetical protein [Pedobacter alpinus]|uniref:Uncharacterized protein n=1 Tax=Pedobacter alpinus TaxID=1590643 RepID=A0ABW5TTV8_9SPHI